MGVRAKLKDVAVPGMSQAGSTNRNKVWQWNPS